jgi:hypothetical protein
VSEPNAALAYRVLDHIDAHPEQWQQGQWIGETECGTVACFAGWTVLLSGGHLDDHDLVSDVPEVTGLHVSIAAFDLLGVDDEELAHRGVGDLFNGGNTREDLGRLVAEIFGPRPGGES